VELPLTREEIRRLMRAHLGQATSEALAGQTQPQYNAYIDTAQLWVAGECRWRSGTQRATLDVGAEQRLIAWPADAAVGSLISAAITTGAGTPYTPLEIRPIPVHADTDLEEAEGGTTFDAVQSAPRYIEGRADGLHLWPVNDSTPRKLRIEYQTRRRFTADGQLSVYDGQAIMLYATALAWKAAGDDRQHELFLGMARERIGTLRAAQNTGAAIRADNGVHFGAYDEELARRMPNWDTRPRT
jgi:hypothetical protein